MSVRFGTAVRAARVTKGVSLRELGRRLEMAPAYVSDIERGNRNPPDVARIRQWAEIVGLDPNELELLSRIDRPSVELPTNGNPTKGELAHILARGWQTMTPDQEQELIDAAKRILERGDE